MATAETELIDGEIVGELEIADRLPQSMMLLKMENESIMAAARIQPRNAMAIVEQLNMLIEAYPAAAEEAVYSRPVGSVSRLTCSKCRVEYETPSIDQNTECPACNSLATRDKHASRNVTKFAEGLSIRAAETIRSVYGYTRLAVTMDRLADGSAKISGTLVDYAAGNLTSDERIVSPKYKARGGEIRTTPEDRFLSVIVKAEKAKLRRDIILDSVPGIIKAMFRDACEKKLVALVAPELIEQKVLPAFAEYGIKLEHLEKMIGRPLKMGWKEEDRLQLRKVLSALKSQETTAAEILREIEGEGDHPANGATSNGSKATKSKLNEKIDTPTDKAVDGMAPDGEIPNDGLPTLDSVFGLIDAARTAIEVDNVRRRYVGPDATEGGFGASEWTEIDRCCNDRIAALSKKPARGQKDLLDKGQPTPE